MGEARRRAAQGLPPRKPQKNSKHLDTSPRVASWLPITNDQTRRFMSIATRGTWIGIGAMIVFWVIVRFVGPASGWWTLADNP
ncbi:DUF2839 domain-containing protein [Synechococcus sp. M16CYN]|uniref:DUF2839 domain-containing protein n=1 Tax=Synechococcus sp. M16CYN TaxID=3103139 RepID=UPI00324B7DCD